jgi:hypothetical protein
LQIYEDESRRIDPEIKDFTYFVSSTYYDFFADDNVAITDIHLEGVRASLAILTERAASIGLKLSFTFGGTYDIEEALGPNRDQSYSGMDFAGKIYFDFTSEELWGRQWVPSAAADARSTNDKNSTGGIVRVNSDYLNIIHPDVNMSSLLVHEVLHLLGLDHSTTSSAMMAYTEFWYPTLSADDLMGLRQVYDIGNGSELNVAVTKDGTAAPGVEVVVIDAISGISYQVIANSKGQAKLRHLSAGSYMVGVRELTPTGPCFQEPTRGFLTTYYGTNGNLNLVANASAIALDANQVVNIAIPVIVGVKKFDCHYARVTAMSDEACNANSFGANTFEESCWLHMAKAGARFTPLIQNDLTIPSHKTITDPNSGAHSSLTIVPIGSTPTINIHKTELLADLENYTRIDLEIGEGAQDGIRSAYCTDGSEQALIGSLIEVQDFGGSLTNRRLLPELVTEMTSRPGPRNFGTYLREGDNNPGAGRRPQNDRKANAAAARDGYGGVGSVPVGADQETEKQKEKKWYQSCGVIGNHANNSAGSPLAALFLIFTPLLVLAFWPTAINLR